MIEQARKGLQSDLGRVPSDKEIARHLDVGKEEFKRIKRDANATAMLSLSRKLAESNTGDGYESDFLRDPDSVDPVDEAQRRDLRAMLGRFLDSTEQLVLVLYYFEGMTMKEIGTTLDLSESRVSQMHSAILDRLRRSLGKTKLQLALEV
jgi:RNA polymerase sigma factor for flagellar operon FliA